MWLRRGFLMSFCLWIGPMCVEACGFVRSDATANFTIALVLTTAKPSGDYNNENMVWWEAAKFALEEGNQLLRWVFPSVSVGFLLINSCGEKSVTMSSIVDILLDVPTSLVPQVRSASCSCLTTTSHNIIGVVGPETSDESAMVANLLLNDEVPVVGFSATSPRLSSKEEFPLFLRTVPADDYQTIVLTKLLKYYDWTYVSLVLLDNDYGEMGQRLLSELFKRERICVEVSEKISEAETVEEVDRVITKLKQSLRSRVVILWVYSSTVSMLLDRAAALGLHGKTWVASDGITEDGVLRKYNADVIHGFLKLNPFNGVYEVFERFFFKIAARHDSEDRWLQWLYNTSIDETENGTLYLRNARHLLSTDYVGSLRNAIFAYFYGLKKYLPGILSCNRSECTQMQPFSRASFFETLKKISFPGLQQKEISFDQQGNIEEPSYVVRALRSTVSGVFFERIGEWSPAQGFLVNTSIKWYRGNADPSKSVCSVACTAGHYAIIDPRTPCCWTCVRCQGNEFKNESGNSPCQKCPFGTVANDNKTGCIVIHEIYLRFDSVNSFLIYGMVAFGFVFALAFIVTFVLHRHTPIVRSSHVVLSLVQMLSQLLLFIVPILLVGRATKFTCMAWVFSLGLLSTVAFAISLVKTEMLVRIFKMQLKFTRKRVIADRSTIIFIIVFVVLLNLGVCGLFILLKPEVATVLLEEDDFDTVEVSCSHENMMTFQLFYTMLLSIVCGVQAFRARKLPQNYNEAKFITFAMFSTSTILICWIPLHYSSLGVIATSVVNALALFLMNFVFIAAMYGYKVYLILFKSEKNSITYFREMRIRTIRHSVDLDMGDLSS